MSQAEGKVVAERYGVPYIETSATIAYNVEQLLVTIVKMLQRGGKKISMSEKIRDLVTRRISRDTAIVSFSENERIDSSLM